MTFDELKVIVHQRCGYDTSRWKESDWHQHPNPDNQFFSGKAGGWVENTASVDPSAVIDNTSFVMQQAQVGPQVVILNNSIVEGLAQVGEKAVIFDNSRIGQRAKIDPGVVIGMRSNIGGTARVNFQVVLGGRTDLRDFFNRNRTRGSLKGVFFKGTHVGQTDEIIQRRNLAVDEWVQRSNASNKDPKVKVGPFPGGRDM